VRRSRTSKVLILTTEALIRSFRIGQGLGLFMPVFCSIRAPLPSPADATGSGRIPFAGEVAADVERLVDAHPAIAPVEPGKWEVPQEPPYAPEDTIGLDAGAGIRIVVTDASGTTIRDDWFELPFARRSDGPCPGPGEFLPVVVT